MTPQQKIFKVLIEHNHILEAGEVDPLLAKTPDPEDIIRQLVDAEQVNATIAQKLLELYQHNLSKQHLPTMHPSASGSISPSAAAVAAVAPPVVTARHVASPTASSVAAPVAPQPTARPPPAAAVASLSAAPMYAASLAPMMEKLGPPLVLPAGPPIKMLLALFQGARELHASDLHVMSGMVPVVRVVSRLREMNAPALTAEQVDACLRSILKPDQIKIFDEALDLDFSYDAGPELGRFRGSYLHQHHGPGGVFRLIPDRVPSFEELKLPPQIRKFTQFSQGIVLVTGPKGSGKTTTLATLIDLINASRSEHIITIEDPIEFVHPCKMGLVDQREVGTHTNSFANALRASLHEAPDVIMVGEMRDLETTSLAITAAETGHLVFGTLHTPDAARTIGRVIDVFPSKDQGQIRAMFSESLRGILSQQLLPGLDGNSVHLATEIMFNTGAIGNLIRDNRAFQIHGIIQTHRHQGMHLMDDSLIDLVRHQKVAAEEVLARANHPAYVKEELDRF